MKVDTIQVLTFIFFIEDGMYLRTIRTIWKIRCKREEG